jgi:hypothetical protein
MRSRIPLKPFLPITPVVVVVVAFSLLAVLAGPDTTQALIGQPIQPFAPNKLGGVSTTQLGQPFTDYGVTEVTRGQRRALSWDYSAPGFSVPSDADIEDGTVVGNVIMRQDVLCNFTTFPGDEDVWAQPTPAPPDPLEPYDWREATTAVEGGPDQFLKSIMPPLPFLLRHKADVDTVWLNGSTARHSPQPLNTVYSQIPWSPGGTAVLATTRQAAAVPSVATALCVDSPDVTTSITTVYTNPALKGDSDADGIDDATGLYPRWTAFQSYPDSRRPFASPPSIASDTRYVERAVVMQCYWLDEDGCYTDAAGTVSCDDPSAGGDGDGHISAQESRNDYELQQMGGIDAVDADHDCLINAAHAQAGRPVDPVDVPTGSLCGQLPYSNAPNVIRYDTAVDEDCDGLVDGIEKAWGSDPQVADSDGDGAPDFIEMFQFSNPNNPDTDGDGYKDAPSGVFGDNTNHAQDNCPAVANPTQLNSDGKHRPIGILNTDSITTTAGPPGTLTDASAAWTQDQWKGQTVLCVQADGITIKGKLTVAPWVSGPFNTLTGTAAWTGTYPNSLCPGGFAFSTLGLTPKNGVLNPNKDKMGDACDPDNDNDGLPDVGETVMGTNPLNPDTNNNHCVDGSEAYLGLNPATGGHNCPVSLTLDQAKFFRACTWALPPLGAYGGLWNAKYSTNADRTELDPDGDSVSCVTGTNVGDKDNDNGTGTGDPHDYWRGWSEVADVTEVLGFNVNPAMRDTDGDGCEDWVQINDVTGDGKVDNADLLEVAISINFHVNAASNEVLDVDKNNKFGTSDMLAVANNMCAINNFGGCGQPACRNSLY